jgi:hypothetical protein
VLKSKLNGQNTIQTINTYVIPVHSYTGGVIEWTESEVEELDRKTRKTLNMYKSLHPRSYTHILYLPRQKGGRGLKEVKAAIQEEKQGLEEYLWRQMNSETPYESCVGFQRNSHVTRESRHQESLEKQMDN